MIINILNCKYKQMCFLHLHNKDTEQLCSTADLIATFLLATQMVQLFFFLNWKFQVSGHRLWPHRWVWDLARNPKDQFSHIMMVTVFCVMDLVVRGHFKLDFYVVLCFKKCIYFNISYLMVILCIFLLKN